jgi:hypothetical protein
MTCGGTMVVGLGLVVAILEMIMEIMALKE